MVKAYIHTIPPEQLTPRQRKDKKYREANREARNKKQSEYCKRKKTEKQRKEQPFLTKMYRKIVG